MRHRGLAVVFAALCCIAGTCDPIGGLDATPGAGFPVGAVMIAALLCIAGPVVVVFARPIGTLGGHSVSIPSGDAVCARMMKSSAALAAAQAKPGAPRSATPAGVVPLARRSLRALVRAVPAVPAAGTADVKALATAALQDANQCITYATTAQMADLASQEFTRALAVVTDTVFCHAPADCAVLGQGCALGWLSGTDTDCRCNVHYGTQADHHVRCEIQVLPARPATPEGAASRMQSRAAS